MAYKKMIVDRLVNNGFDVEKTGKCYFWYLKLTTGELLTIERKFLEKKA